MCRWRCVACLVAMLSLASATARGDTLEDAAQPIADSGNPVLVRAGMLHYKALCAQCHGRNLQGQPLWQVLDADLHRRAPALDDTGHAWQHSDADLVQMIQLGRFPGTPASAVSTMPGFAAVLRDQQILEVIAFIKGRWALGLRVSQATLNPGFAGMPEGSQSVPWTLPPNCSSSALQDWRKGSEQPQ